MSLAKKIAVVVASLLVLAGAGLTFLVSTQTGLTLAGRLAAQSVPGFAPGTLTGSLLKFRAEGFSYEASGLSVSGTLAWDFNASALTAGRVELNELALTDVSLRVKSAPEKTPATEPAPEKPAKPAAQKTSSEAAPAPLRLAAPLPVQIRSLRLENISADIDGTRAAVARFTADALWEKEKVTVRSAALSDVTVEIPSSPEPETSKPLGETIRRTLASPLVPQLPDIVLPVDVALDSFALTNLSWGKTEAERLERLTFALYAEGETVRVEKLALRHPRASLEGSVSAGLTAPHALDAALTLSAVVPRESIPTGKIAEPEPPTTEEIETFYARLKDARARQLEEIKVRRAARGLKAPAPRPAVDTAKMTKEERRAHNRKERERVMRRLERWRQSVRGLLPEKKPEPPVKLKAAVNLTGALGTSLVLTGSVENVPGLTGAALSLKATPAAADFPFEAFVRADTVELSGLTLAQNIVSVKGTAADYVLAGRSLVRMPLEKDRVFASTLTLTGEGSALRLHLADLSAASNAGLVRLDGQFDWSRDFFFTAALAVEKVDTAELMPDTPLTLNGGFTAWGSLKDGRWKSSVQDLTLMGELRGQPIALTASLASDGKGRLDVPALYFAAGRNSLELAGSLDAAPDVPTLDFKIKIDAPSLGVLDPQMKGSVKGSLHVSGSTRLPIVNADVTARGVAYAGTSLKEARLTGRMRSRETVSGSLTLALDSVADAGWSMKTAKVILRGSEVRHTLSFEAQGAPVSVKGTVTGLYERMLGNWAGALSTLKVTTEYGDVALEKPMRISLVPALSRLNIARACLAHADARVCLKNDLQVDLSLRTPLRVLVGLEKFDLAFVEKNFKGRLRTSGIITGALDMTLPAGLADLPTGTVRFSTRGVQTTYRSRTSDLRIGVDSASLTFANTRDSIRSNWNIALTDNGTLEGNLAVGDIFAARTIAGTLRFNALKASLVNSFLSPGEKAEGEIHGDLRFAGTFEEPLVYGRTGIRALKLDSTKLPFEMLPSDLLLTFEGNTSTLAGELKTAKGSVAYEGQADWSTLSEGKAVVTAKGEAVRLTIPPDIELDLTSNVKCEVSAERIKLSGFVKAPWARVAVTELPASVVEVSDDVVRVDRPRPPKREGKPIAVESSLFIRIGDDVRVEAMGLKARLTGRLSVIQDKNTLGLTGQISVPQGTFKAYGQDLIVRRGEFNFTGPAANPLIDLEAIRNPEKTADDVTVGIRVTGTAEMPQVAVFTDPVKSETETLSYLIRGEGLDPSGDSDNTMITSALINLGLGQGSQVVESLGDAVGISGLGLDTEGVGESSQLVVSGYVLPGLKVKYGVGIFDSLATLTLRYRIIPRLYIEAVSGVDQALDLLYAFEF